MVVTGGRDFRNVAVIDRALRAVERKHGAFTLIHGTARGVDSLCAEWAEGNGMAVEAFPADWEALGKMAGFVRNQQMIDEGRPDAAIAFPGGRGTADMTRRLRKAGIPLWIIPDQANQ